MPDPGKREILKRALVAYEPDYGLRYKTIFKSFVKQLHKKLRLKVFVDDNEMTPRNGITNGQTTTQAWRGRYSNRSTRSFI